MSRPIRTIFYNMVRSMVLGRCGRAKAPCRRCRDRPYVIFVEKVLPNPSVLSHRPMQVSPAIRTDAAVELAIWFFSSPGTAERIATLLTCQQALQQLGRVGQ